jgi:hypothetical protein
MEAGAEDRLVCAVGAFYTVPGRLDGRGLKPVFEGCIFRWDAPVFEDRDLWLDASRWKEWTKKFRFVLGLAHVAAICGVLVARDRPALEFRAGYLDGTTMTGIRE